MTDTLGGFESHVHGTPYPFRAFPGGPRADGIVVDSSGYPRDPYLHCGFCGSVSIATALDLLETPGVRWSMADWKYGGPHKFYLEVPHAPFDAKMGSRSWVDGSGQRVEEPIMGTHTAWNLKFYTEHLTEAEPDQIARWNRVMAPRCGVSFELQDGRLMWRLSGEALVWWGTVEAPTS